MRLILAEYIDALKEDGELDKLIQDILRQHGIAIISAPERGRQYGVDIYAVGKDFEDNGRKKVFLITVKQGDLDRKTWHGDQNALYQSLEEIRTVFIKNNIATQHRNLPIKVVVAFNGLLRQNMQQNWRGYAEANPDYEYTLWNNDWLLTQFEEKLLSQDAFSLDSRSLLRKTIIHLENPDYQLQDFSALLSLISAQFKKAKSKKAKLQTLRELHVCVLIVLKYTEQTDNLMHAVRVTEKYVLALWPIIDPGEPDKDFTLLFIGAYEILSTTFLKYYQKISFIGLIRDGYGRSTHNSLIYTYTVYEQVGIISMTGLILLQLGELLGSQDFSAQNSIQQNVLKIANTLTETFNNNSIIYSPRADEHHIEICLSLILFQKLGLYNQINSILSSFSGQMTQGFSLLGIFPEFHNDRRTIAELEVNYEKRRKYDYKASNLFTVLSEWAAVTKQEACYNLYFQIREELTKDINLLLWFPEKETEQILYTQYATLESGYTLSNIELPDSMDAMREQMRKEYAHNCHEKNFGFIKEGFWTIGLIASRHYRTYIFPHYWRQFIDTP